MSYWKHIIEGIEWSDYKLWERELIFAEICKENSVSLDQPPYAIIWEDPTDLDDPVKITVPSPIWWAMALHGHILPPVNVYWELKKDESQPDFKIHTRGHLLHETPPVNPMTPEEAMEYLIMKDIPTEVWDKYKGNRKILKIVSRDMIPTDRTYRGAWRLVQENREMELADG